MAFNYNAGYGDLEGVFEGLLDVIVNSFSAYPWSLVYTNPESTSLNLSTVTGTESTTNKIYVLRAKLYNNSESTADNAYAYIILEKDTALSRVIVRTCNSFSSGGSSVNVTPYADVVSCGLFLDTLNTDNGVSFNGEGRNVTVSVRSVSGVSAVTLACLKSYPTIFNQDNAFVLLKAESDKAYAQSNTNFTGKTLDRYVPDVVLTSSLQPSGQVGTQMVVSDGDTFVGFIDRVYKSGSTTPANYDIIDVYFSTLILRAFIDGSGYIAVEN